MESCIQTFKGCIQDVGKFGHTVHDSIFLFTLFTIIFFVPQIHWDRRLIGSEHSKAKTTVDGVDMHIFEPFPFNTKWFSHKFRGPGWRYEIGVATCTSNIVWTNGPFQCGRIADLTIFQAGLKYKIPDNELVIADRGYRGEAKIQVKGSHPSGAVNRWIARALARHEKVNKHVKQWKIMDAPFRNKLDKHKIAFRSIIVMTQINITMEYPLFD